jgi:hypothetical protein
VHYKWSLQVLPRSLLDEGNIFVDDSPPFEVIWPSHMEAEGARRNQRLMFSSSKP